MWHHSNPRQMSGLLPYPEQEQPRWERSLQVSFMTSTFELELEYNKWSNMLFPCSCSFIWGCNTWLGCGAAACPSNPVCSAHHSYNRTSPTGSVLFPIFFLPLLFHAITSFDFFTVSVFKQVEIVGKPQPATPSQPATPGTEHELQQYRKSYVVKI